MKFHDTIVVMKAKKFATQIDEKVLKDLKAHAKLEGKSISKIVTQAVHEYINKVKIRPAFRSAMNEVISDNDELLKRLAK
jgi:hypothetical protein